MLREVSSDTSGCLMQTIASNFCTNKLTLKSDGYDLGIKKSYALSPARRIPPTKFNKRVLLIIK